MVDPCGCQGGLSVGTPAKDEEGALHFYENDEQTQDFKDEDIETTMKAEIVTDSAEFAEEIWAEYFEDQIDDD